MSRKQQGRHPPHLKGKDIGMFYAKRGKKKEEAENKSTLFIDNAHRNYLSRLLSSTRDENAQSAPQTFFSDRSLSSTSLQSKFRQGQQHSTSLNNEMLNSFRKKQEDPAYRSFQENRRKLPIFKRKKEILDLIDSNQVIVLSGETGCGKTTQLTQYILDQWIENGRGSECNIVCTQPRRISAIAVAERVAVERAERLQESVGYSIRLESRHPKNQGSILYCTTGILLQWMISDRNMKAISHIVLDEAHERNLDSDFLIIILKELLPSRPDLKIIIMSATINADLFSTYFDNCSQITIPGFTFHVEKFMLEDVLEITMFDPRRTTKKWVGGPRRKGALDSEVDPVAWEEYLETLPVKYSQKTARHIANWDEDTINLDLILALITHISVSKPDGAILVFLTGWKEIADLNKLIKKDPMLSNNRKFLVITLHSKMPTINQKQVFDKPPLGVRKIILATNIAETSITIDDVVYVIDSGKIKMSNYNDKRDLATLKPQWASLANSQQRRGRAGRVQAGECYHLYSSFREELLSPYILAEMLRTRLENICLNIKILNLGSISDFLQKAIEPPSPLTITHSISLLQKMNALDEKENLTPLGYHLARLPLDPYTGKMILFGCIFSCLDPILTVAASLSFKDAFCIPLGKERAVDAKKRELAKGSFSDHVMMINAFNGWEEAKENGDDRAYCYDNYLSSSTLTYLRTLKTQLAQYLRELNFLDTLNTKHPDYNINSNNNMVLTSIICAGLYPNVAKVLGMQSQKCAKICTRTDKRVEHHPMSVNSYTTSFPSQWLVYYHKVESNSIMLHDTTCASPYALLFFGGDMKQKGAEVTIDSWITFDCSPSTSNIFRELKGRLNNYLEYKIANPGPTDLNKEEVLMAIIDLLTDGTTFKGLKGKHRYNNDPEPERCLAGTSGLQDRKFFFDDGYKEKKGNNYHQGKSRTLLNEYKSQARPGGKKMAKKQQNLYDDDDLWSD